MFIRPVTLDDHPAVLAVAKAAGIGMTSLPADSDVLYEKVKKSAKSVAGEASTKGQEIFLFVMEDPDSGEIVGTTGIKAHVGLNQPFYSYKLTTIAQQCRDLEIFSEHKLLQVTNDLTGNSEIGSLFLLPHYRRDRLGRLLSLCRFLFIAAHPDIFSDHIIAEMRGFHDPEGGSPFYDSIAKHFFEMEFPKADYYNATQGNQFINDLMPKYPIYMDLLAKEAQQVVGQPHPNSEPARAMLEMQGFRWNGYVDIFDGGPTLQVARDLIKTVRESRTGTIEALDDSLEEEKHMISNDQLADFRCGAGRLRVLGDDSITITSKAARLLNVKEGDVVRYIPHHSRS